ncbi:hypothetical protein [Thalassolituus sp.]|uniref:hypothetical protein n=1 Tax=Thalassolituus sp. TaxID=2030822 RepID=UPI003516C8A5
MKTGSIKKLKRESGNDRQSGKRVARKNKSVFEKFLESNPEAKQQLNTEQKQVRENNTPTAKPANSSQKGSSQKTGYNEGRAADNKDAKTSQSRQQEQDKRVERDDDLLGMLDSIKRDEDLY